LCFEKSDPGDAHVVELATKLLADQSHRASTELVISFTEIAARLKTTPETLHRLAGIIESKLQKDGVAASLEWDYVRLRQN
jgi:hypothetical protein